MRAAPASTVHLPRLAGEFAVAADAGDGHYGRCSGAACPATAACLLMCSYKVRDCLACFLPILHIYLPVIPTGVGFAATCPLSAALRSMCRVTLEESVHKGRHVRQQVPIILAMRVAARCAPRCLLPLEGSAGA